MLEINNKNNSVFSLCSPACSLLKKLDETIPWIFVCQIPGRTCPLAYTALWLAESDEQYQPSQERCIWSQRSQTLASVSSHTTRHQLWGKNGIMTHRAALTNIFVPSWSIRPEPGLTLESLVPFPSPPLKPCSSWCPKAGNYYTLLPLKSFIWFFLTAAIVNIPNLVMCFRINIVNCSSWARNEAVTFSY